jgi:hypothetical protein
MKNKILLIGIMTVLFSIQLTSQTIYSNGTGGGLWSNSATWLGGTVPNVSNDVIIAAGDSVTTTIGAVCKSLTVFSEGRIATSIDTVYVAETLTLESDAWFYNNTDRPKLPGSDYFLDPQSYVVHGNGTSTVGGEGNLEFGNLIIMRSAGGTPGGNLLIHGDLIINNTASNVVFRGVRPATGSMTHTVEGNLYIYKGTLSCIDVGDNSMTGIWNIAGNAYVIDNRHDSVYQESRIGLFSSANAAGYAEINIGGDLILQGGRLQGGTSSSAGPGNGVFTIGGNVSLDINSNTATNTLGSVGIVFNGTEPQHIDMNVKFQMSTVVNTTINGGSEVIFDLDTNKWGSTSGGDFTVNGSLELMGSSYLDGAGSFILNPGAVLKIGSPVGISIADAVGNIQVTGARSFSPDAIYEYKSAVPQQFGDALPNPVYGLAVNNINSIELDRDLTINGTLNIINGDLLLNNHTVTLGGDAVLTESAGNTVSGAAGKIMTIRDLNSPSGVNAGGLGAVLTSAANLGSTLIERYHYTSAGGGNEGINRVYNIAPSNNTSLNAAVRLHYDESELNNIPEADLRMFKSSDGSNNPWDKLWGNVNTAENYVEASEVNELGYLTLASINNPLPVEEELSGLPEEYSLQQNFPNPFNPSTVIKFDLPENSHVNLIVYNLLGEKIIVLLNETLEAGRYARSFDSKGLPSGLYIYMLQTDTYSSSKKMIVLK